MNVSSSRRFVAAAAGVCAGLGVAAPSSAAPCDTLGLPTPVYISGSSAVKPELKQAGAALAGLAQPITILYQGSASCDGPDAIVNATKVTSTATYWDATGAEKTCDPPVGGLTSHIGASDVYASTCGITLTAGAQADFLGPIQVMNFIAPVASTETSISADAAYVALGFGGTQYPLAPWTDPSFLFHRVDTSGTKKMIGTAIDLAVAKWKGQALGKSSDVLTKVATSANPNATLGILASDVADTNRNQIKILAYQHKGQSCGYYPDSSPSSFDKINVREGRYAIWGPLHLITAVDGTGKPSNAGAARVIAYFTRDGLTAAEKKTMIDVETAGHTVPQCAMKVKRTSEVGAMTSFVPDEPCGCYFEFKATGQASSSCKACSDDSACSGGTPKCRYGYCEAK